MTEHWFNGDIEIDGIELYGELGLVELYLTHSYAQFDKNVLSEHETQALAQWQVVAKQWNELTNEL